MSHETLSSLLDGECSPQELQRLLQELEHSPELRQAYSRMCLAREAREGTRIIAASPGFCDGVMARLEALPEADLPKVVELAPRRARFALHWRPVAGLAAAASLGALAVLVAVPQVRTGTTGASPGLSPSVTAPVSLPGKSSRPRNQQTVSADVDDLPQSHEDDLAGYLIEHNNTLADRGMGTLSYARFTAHTAQPRTAEFRPQQQSQQQQVEEQR